MVSIHKKHYPAEIFGYPIENKSEETLSYRAKYLCPFTKEFYIIKCTK